MLISAMLHLGQMGPMRILLQSQCTRVKSSGFLSLGTFPMWTRSCTPTCVFEMQQHPGTASGLSFQAHPGVHWAVPYPGKGLSLQQHWPGPRHIPANLHHTLGPSLPVTQLSWGWQRDSQLISPGTLYLHPIQPKTHYSCQSRGFCLFYFLSHMLYTTLEIHRSAERRNHYMLCHPCFASPP